MSETQIALEKFREGFDFDYVKSYIQSNVRADAPGYNLTQDAYQQYQAEVAAANAKLEAQKQTELSQKDSTPTFATKTNLVLPAALFIGGLLIVLGIRSKK